MHTGQRRSPDRDRGPLILSGGHSIFHLMRPVLTSLPLWGITLVAALRGMAFVSFITFLPLYLEDERHLSETSLGLHLALLVLVGIGAPIAGYLSDRLGRKIVLVPGLLGLCALTLLLVPFRQGVMLAVPLRTPLRAAGPHAGHHGEVVDCGRKS